MTDPHSQPHTTSADVSPNDNAAFGLATFAAHLNVVSLPSQTLKHLKRLLTDTLGVILGAQTEDHVAQVQAVVRAGEARPKVSVFGTDLRTSVADAALANGTAAHGIDFDDTHRFVHPGCAVVPGVLAVAEDRDLSGGETLIALAAGYEVSIRVAFAAGAVHRQRGYHPTGTCNVFGAAVGAAKAMGLDVDGIASAIGIASSMAGGLTQYRFDGAANKHLHGGLAARGGVLAAQLAAEGFRGTKGALDGDLGFLRTCADLSEKHCLSDDLGQRFHLDDTDIKPYPSCRQSHASIDLARSLWAREDIDTSMIERIDISIYTYADKPWYTVNISPDTPLEAMLRIPFCVASALVYGDVGMAQFSEQALQDQRVRDLAARVKVLGDPALDASWPDDRAVRLMCTMRDGATITLSARNPKGGSDNPLTDHDIQDKFRALVSDTNAAANADTLFDVIENLEQAASVHPLIRMIMTSNDTSLEKQT